MSKPFRTPHANKAPSRLSTRVRTRECALDLALCGLGCDEDDAAGSNSFIICKANAQSAGPCTENQMDREAQPQLDRAVQIPGLPGSIHYSTCFLLPADSRRHREHTLQLFLRPSEQTSPYVWSE